MTFFFLFVRTKFPYLPTSFLQLVAPVQTAG
jgi:hypothetical protein